MFCVMSVYIKQWMQIFITTVLNVKNVELLTQNWCETIKDKIKKSRKTTINWGHIFNMVNDKMIYLFYSNQKSLFKSIIFWICQEKI